MESFNTIWQTLAPVLTHEYAMGFYGAAMWHLEVFWSAKNKADDADQKFGYWDFIKKEWDDVWRSMHWVAIGIVMDDEILAVYNSWAETDIHDLAHFEYFIAGFCIDRIVNMLKKKRDEI